MGTSEELKEPSRTYRESRESKRTQGSQVEFNMLGTSRTARKENPQKLKKLNGTPRELLGNLVGTS